MCRGRGRGLVCQRWLLRAAQVATRASRPAPPSACPATGRRAGHCQHLLWNTAHVGSGCVDLGLLHRRALLHRGGFCGQRHQRLPQVRDDASASPRESCFCASAAAANSSSPANPLSGVHLRLPAAGPAGYGRWTLDTAAGATRRRCSSRSRPPRRQTALPPLPMTGQPDDQQDAPRPALSYLSISLDTPLLHTTSLTTYCPCPPWRTRLKAHA